MCRPAGVWRRNERRGERRVERRVERRRPPTEEEKMSILPGALTRRTQRRCVPSAASPTTLKGMKKRVDVEVSSSKSDRTPYKHHQRVTQTHWVRRKPMLSVSRRCRYSKPF